VLTLVGDIATTDGGPAVHAHAVLELRDRSTVGGHLRRAVAGPTLEVIVTESRRICTSGSTSTPGWR
jgi:predicted DNA-binding protein with PD1-like motif